MGNRGRHLSQQKGWEEFIQPACMGTVSNLSLHYNSYGPTSTGPNSCTSEPRAYQLYNAHAHLLVPAAMATGNSFRFPVSTCHFYFLLYFHSFVLPAPMPSLDSTAHI